MARLWLLPNLLSLDAPLVALAWQDLLARSTHLPLPPQARLSLGLSVWAIYLADRILDARRPFTTAEAPRHQFYRNHPLAARTLLALVLLATTVSVILLPSAIVKAGFLVLAAVAVYLAAIHSGVAPKIPKEFAVALLFPTGTFLAAWVASPHPAPLLLLFLPFFLLCLGNLCVLETWEWRRWGSIGARPSDAVRKLADTLPYWATLLGLISLAVGSAPWYLASGISALLLATLARFHKKLPPDVRRVLADALLLTPLFLR
ncbi:MAG: hypothetical protein ABI693_34880 [Bryobacteraceae bacterium]